MSLSSIRSWFQKGNSLFKLGFLFSLLMVHCTSIVALNVVFRCDDPRISYDSINNRILDVFIANKVPLSIAMIPCDTNERPHIITDSLYWHKLNNPLIEICLHGLTHQNFDDQGEFGSLSREETSRRIHLGKSILQPYFERPIETFIPPYNVINTYLPSVLRQEGFHNLSSDLFDQVITDDVLYYPETLGLLMKQLGFWSAAKEAVNRNRNTSNLCVIMFHAYNLPNEESWDTLQSFLEECRSDQRIKLYLYSDLRVHKIEGTAQRYNANKLEGFLQKYCLSRGVLHSSTTCYFVHICSTILYLLVCVICLLTARNIVRNNTKGKKIITISGFIFIFIITIISIYHFLGPIKLWLLDIGFSLMLILFALTIRYITQNQTTK